MCACMCVCVRVCACARTGARLRVRALTFTHCCTCNCMRGEFLSVHTRTCVHVCVDVHTYFNHWMLFLCTVYTVSEGYVSQSVRVISAAACTCPTAAVFSPSSTDTWSFPPVQLEFLACLPILAQLVGLQPHHSSHNNNHRSILSRIRDWSGAAESSPTVAARPPACSPLTPSAGPQTAPSAPQPT